MTRLSSNIVDVDSHDQKVAFDNFVSECAVLQDSSSSRHTLCLLSTSTIQQDSSILYSSSYIHTIVMSTVSKQNVQLILLDLSKSERDAICNQLTSVLK